jgi:hypothetical protein
MAQALAQDRYRLTPDEIIEHFRQLGSLSISHYDRLLVIDLDKATRVNVRLSVNLGLGRSNVRFSDGQSHGAWISRTSPGINTFVEGSINVRLSVVFCETNYDSRLAPGVRLH